jgi:RNA polymerase sigma-70 factor (ECF subfamily)
MSKWIHGDFAGTIGERVEAARPRLLRLARLNGIGPDEAEDVVQETFLEAWRHLEKLREPERLLSWLDGICRNICKRHLHMKAAAPDTSELPEDLDEVSTSLSDMLSIDPVEELERQDMHILLGRALGHLSAGTREVVELCYLLEQPQREVAQRLGMSLGALELKLHRARRQLHQVLHGELREDAQAFGLLLTQEESTSWQETRQWCFLCGKRRLRAIVEPQPSGVVALRLRCPDCSPRYQLDLLNTANYPDSGPIRSFLPAVKRILQSRAEVFQIGLNQRRCPACQSPVKTQIIDRSALAPPYRHYDSLPMGIYGRVDCPACGTFLCEAFIPVQQNPAVRNFLLRPRVLYEPATFATYAGQQAIRFRLIDLVGNETLTIIAHPQTMQLIATLQE